jgi:hypothetical protein
LPNQVRAAAFFSQVSCFFGDGDACFLGDGDVSGWTAGLWSVLSGDAECGGLGEPFGEFTSGVTAIGVVLDPTEKEGLCGGDIFEGIFEGVESP